MVDWPFFTGENSRKGRILDANPEVLVHSESGDECVILEGGKLRSNLDELYREKYDGYPLVGYSPVFILRPRKVIAWREADFPSSATRWILTEEN